MDDDFIEAVKQAIWLSVDGIEKASTERLERFTTNSKKYVGIESVFDSVFIRVKHELKKRVAEKQE